VKCVVDSKKEIILPPIILKSKTVLQTGNTILVYKIYPPYPSLPLRLAYSPFKFPLKFKQNLILAVAVLLVLCLL
jgi:hypothetical protein